MERQGSRFKNYMDDNLVHLHKNLYISTGDPLYYDKVIRYLDPHSPEAHFKLAERNRERGHTKKALFHFNEVLRTYPSPYYAAANRAIKEMTLKKSEEQARQEEAASEPSSDGRMPSFMKAMLIVLLLLNVLIISLYFGADSISSTISKYWAWGIGQDVTYESVDVPYYMYFLSDTAAEKVESALHQKAIELAKEQPKHSVLIYGMVSSSLVQEDKAIPLTDDSMTRKAFVTAQFNSTLDKTVRIRFLDPDFQKHEPLTDIGANLVRTAIHTYMNEHGQAPESISQLLQNYPHNYLSFLPLEPHTQSNAVTQTYNGDGGWVYDGTAKETTAMFYPNIHEGISSTYAPYHIQISKKDHTLKLLTGSNLLFEQAVGLGKLDQTPQGQFEVLDRVIHPAGSKPDVYGSAGLGLGSIAIHGTTNKSSIGADQSLGCIRLSNTDVEALYAFVPKGTLVEIKEDESGALKDNKPTYSSELARIVPGHLLPLDESAKGIVFHWLG
jgi:lipoprotein-anchoring transpeptidase ErfK/SrfK